MTIWGFCGDERIDLIHKASLPFLGPPAFRGHGSWCGGGGAREFGAASREGGFREGDFTRAGGSGRFRPWGWAPPANLLEPTAPHSTPSPAALFAASAPATETRCRRAPLPDQPRHPRAPAPPIPSRKRSHHATATAVVWWGLV